MRKIPEKGESGAGAAFGRRQRRERRAAKGWVFEAKGCEAKHRARSDVIRRGQDEGRRWAGMDAGRERGWMRAGRGQAADRHRLEPGQSANHTAILAADITAKTISVTGITVEPRRRRRGQDEGWASRRERGQASRRSIGPGWMRAGAGNRGQAEGKMDAGRRGQDKREARLRERSFGPGWVGCGQARASWMRSGAGRLREGMG